MSIIKNFKKSEYQYPDYFKITNTDLSNDIKKLERYTGTIFGQGDVIKSEDHNEIQKNGVIFSKPVYSKEGEISVYSLEDFILEQEIFEGLKLKLLIDTDTESETLNIKINNVNYPINEKFISGNLYNLVYVNNEFIVEKNGGSGGASFRTLVDENISIQPQKEITETNIILPEEEYNLIKITLYFLTNIAGQNVISTMGLVTSKEVFIRSEYLDVNSVNQNCIKCEPSMMYSDSTLYLYAKPEIQNTTVGPTKIYFWSPYGYPETFNRIKIDVL